MKGKWLKFKEGFLSVWRLLYPADEDIDWYAQVGRILGVITIFALWNWVGECIVDLVLWMVT